LQPQGLSQPQLGAQAQPPFAWGLQPQASWLHFEHEQSGLAFLDDMTAFLSERWAQSCRRSPGLGIT
jgi:hypothetical protein